MKRHIPYVGQNLNGILRYLYDNDRNNYFDTVQTYASSSYGQQYYPVNAINFGSTNLYWHAIEFDKIGHYIVVHLKNYYIKIEGYSIQTAHYGPSTSSYPICNIRNWGFDASNDGKNWVHQENKTDDGTLNNRHASKYIRWSHGVYNYFRVMVTGDQYDGIGKKSIDLNQIEFFGTLASRRSLLYSRKPLKFNDVLGMSLFR